MAATTLVPTPIPTTVVAQTTTSLTVAVTTVSAGTSLHRMGSQQVTSGTGYIPVSKYTSRIHVEDEVTATVTSMTTVTSTVDLGLITHDNSGYTTHNITNSLTTDADSAAVSSAGLTDSSTYVLTASDTGYLNVPGTDVIAATDRPTGYPNVSVTDVFTAFLNFSKSFEKSPAHLHIAGNVIVKFE